MHRFTPEATVPLTAGRRKLNTDLLNVGVHTPGRGQRAVSFIEHISTVPSHIGASTVRIKLAEDLYRVSIRHRRTIHLSVIGGFQDMGVDAEEKLSVSCWGIR